MSTTLNTAELTRVLDQDMREHRYFYGRCICPDYWFGQALKWEQAGNRNYGGGSPEANYWLANECLNRALA